LTSRLAKPRKCLRGEGKDGMGGLSEVGTQCREGIRHDSTEGKFAGEKQKENWKRLSDS